MESIIARQKIARRRPTPIIGTAIAGPANAPIGRAPRFPGLFHPRRTKACRDIHSDFLFLEGAVDRAARTTQRPGQRIGRHRPQTDGPTAGTSRVEAPRDPLPSLVAGASVRHGGGAGGLRTAYRALIAAARAALGRLGERLAGLGSKKAVIAAVVLGLGVALAVAATLLREPAFPMPSGAFLPEDGATADLLLSYAVPDGVAADEDDGPRDAPPPPPILEIQTYTVRSGDSVAAIAKRFHLSADSIVSINGISSAKAIKAGTVLKIPNIDGLVYRVRSGDNLGAIARRYKTDMTRLADANDLGSSVLVPGQALFIPGAKLSTSELKRIFGELVAWPLRGSISSYFGYRPNPFTGIRQFHAGIDIVAAPGFPIRAAMDGKVSDAGYNTVFGNYVILSHADGFQTLYGHMTAYSVKTGQRISQGSVIGTVGSTGYSTGPHVHFGLFKRGAAVNPLKYLK